MKFSRAAIIIALVAVPYFFSGCSTLPSATKGAATRLDPASVPRPAEHGPRQLLVVVGEGTGRIDAALYALESADGRWRLHRGPIAATVGRNGFAAPGEKVEGDGKTPSGLFPLEFAFGYDPAVVTGMPYRQATYDDLWVDDVGSPQYNTWVRRGETAAKSYEVMRLPDRRYRHGIVIGYNRNPVVPGKGSAIFVHAWLEEGKPTAGCVSLDEAVLVGILGWLDPDKKPMILMGNREELPAIAETLTRMAP